MNDIRRPFLNAMPIEERIDRWMARLVKQEGDCWAWHGSRNRLGYGSVGILGKTVPAHRVFYEYFVADIPNGLEIDHLCRKRNCVNPWHLEPVTRKVNMERAIGVGKYDRSHLKATHCSQGHALTGSNVYTYGRKRRCRKCLHAKARERYLRRRNAIKGGDS